jgi:hypothetical protein
MRRFSREHLCKFLFFDAPLITFAAEQPLLALMYFAKQTKKILRGRRSEGFFSPISFFRKTPAGGNRALPFPRRSARESAAAAL